MLFSLKAQREKKKGQSLSALSLSLSRLPFPLADRSNLLNFHSTGGSKGHVRERERSMATASSCRDGGTYYRLDGKGSNDDGKQWDDGAGGDVREICICHGPVIYSIQTTYDRRGTLLCSRRHGGTDGDFDFISLSSPLTWVSGHYSSWCWDPDLLFPDEETQPYNFCKVVRSLKFGTADGATYGPYGREIGVPFDFRSSTGIAGFHGRGDSVYLNAIGVYLKSAARGVIDDPPVSGRGASADVNSGPSPTSSSSTKLPDEPKA